MKYTYLRFSSLFSVIKMPKKLFSLLLNLIYFTLEIRSHCCFHSFYEIYSKCGETFPISKEISSKILQPNDMQQALEIIKGDYQAKCYVHCIFNSLGIVNENGDISNGDLIALSALEGSENIKKITNISEQNNPVKDIIKRCEPTVKSEHDPCLKTFALLLCLNFE